MVEKVITAIEAPDSEPDYGASFKDYPNKFKRRTISAKPYMGVESYQFEDAELFFGRKIETSELAALFSRGPLSVLHAPSGAGKTSLLNARVIPELERDGVYSVRLTPQDNPLEAVRVNTLLQLIPAPETEAHAIAEFLKRFPELSEVKLEEAITHYDEIKTDESDRRQLLAPYEVTVWFDPYRRRVGHTLPFFCRLLSGTVTIRAFWRHFAALFDFDRTGQAIRDDEWRAATLSEIRDLLGSERAIRAHREWIDCLDIPEYGFVRFFENICNLWGSKQSGYTICLIVDQFEEIFTRFTDVLETEVDKEMEETDEDSEDLALAQNENTAQPDRDWRLRPSFFAELKKLLTYRSRAGNPLPVKIVLSMRDEYLGRLKAVRDLRPFWEDTQYRLDFINKRDAHRIISEPAKIYRYGYTKECYDWIVTALLREDRYLEPAHVQIICEKLWDTVGQKHYSAAVTEEDSGAPKSDRLIDRATFKKATGGPKRILRRYFRDTLSELSEEEDQLEALDMMNPLVTNQGTRNVVEVSEIINAPLRDSKQRKRLLTHMQRKNIIRVEPRLGGEFAEITHEFLLKPLRREVMRRLVTSAEEQAFRFALQSVAAALTGHGTQREQAARLSQPVLEIILKNRPRVVWTRWAISIVLRAAVVHGASAEDFRELFELFNSKITERRGAALKIKGPEDTKKLCARFTERQERADWLGQDELSIVGKETLPQLDDTGPAYSSIAEFCLLSVLHRAGPEDADLIRTWIDVAKGIAHAPDH
ncbi:MAG: ATP-binding protein [Alphaproteobacteria bacterium]|nr:ATP-binding protein [Alphaproteobacteria bacterium]